MKIILKYTYTAFIFSSLIFFFYIFYSNIKIDYIRDLLVYELNSIKFSKNDYNILFLFQFKDPIGWFLVFVIYDICGGYALGHSLILSILALLVYYRICSIKSCYLYNLLFVFTLFIPHYKWGTFMMGTERSLICCTFILLSHDYMIKNVNIIRKFLIAFFLILTHVNTALVYFLGCFLLSRKLSIKHILIFSLVLILFITYFQNYIVYFSGKYNGLNYMISAFYWLAIISILPFVLTKKNYILQDFIYFSVIIFSTFLYHIYNTVAIDRVLYLFIFYYTCYVYVNLSQQNRLYFIFYSLIITIITLPMYLTNRVL